MASWLLLLIGLWMGLGLGMAVTAFVFMPATRQIVIEQQQVKSPQRMLADLLPNNVRQEFDRIQSGWAERQ